MNDEIFVKKAAKLMHKIRLDYDMCKDIEGDAKALELVCHNFIYLRNIKNRKKNNEKTEKENENQ